MKAVVVYSGGMDSFTLLHRARAAGWDVLPISFNYGQRHVKELYMAAEVCRELRLEHRILDISDALTILGGSSLTSQDIEVPEGHFEDESMKVTVVPNRNMILLSFAIGFAINSNCSRVYYGAHAGDHAIYPDCRPEFVEAMQDVADVASYEPIEIVTPYLDTNKVGILKEGLELGLDYSKTWTCYNGRDLACGKCGSCQERLEAFAACGVRDPLTYEN